MNDTNDSAATQPADIVQTLAALKNPPLHIVLVSPQIPPNTGNVARLCAATGCALHLVEPMGFTINDRDLKRAGLDYWGSLGVVIHPSFEAFLATPIAENAWFLSTRAKQSYATAEYQHADALVFGSETAGLPASILAARPDRSVRIPMRAHAVRSLNLSTSVGIVTYAALAQLGMPGLE
jgi:tRNA (cytidine/uridine-2'-O-)-methyltransferase